MRVAYLSENYRFSNKPFKRVTEIIDVFLNDDSCVEMRSADGNNYVSMETVDEGDFCQVRNNLLQKGFDGLPWTFTLKALKVQTSECHAFDDEDFHG